LFKPNDGHRQGELFSDFQRFNPVVAKRLKNSWAMVFYEQVFCFIREELFASLYSLEWGRPNFPVNILIGLEIIKHLFDYTDQELLDQYYFNYQVQYALGIRNIGEVYLGERTLYNFRERVVSYSKEYPEKEALPFQQFEILTQNFLGVAGLKTDELRIDSTLISPNIKKAGRLSLAHDVLAQAVRVIPSSYRSDNLSKVMEDSFKNKLLYQTRNSQLDSRFQTVLDLMSEIYALTKTNKDIADMKEVKILLRFLNEQADYDETSGQFKAKSDDIKINLHYTDMTGKGVPEGQLPAHHFTFNKEMEMEQCPGGQIPTSSKYI